jgi:hypothetical protein
LTKKSNSFKHVQAALTLTNDPHPEQDLEEENLHGDELEEEPPSQIESIQFTQELINEIWRATLDNEKLEQDVVERLQNPTEGPANLSDPDIRLSIDLYMACNNAAEATYTAVRQSILLRFPHCSILTYHRVKKLVAELSGIVSVLDDMCINSCHAFVGPYTNLTTCNKCGEP